MKGLSQRKLDGEGLRAGIVVSRFNATITQRLKKGAISALLDHGVRREDIEVAEVWGAFELPQALKIMAQRKNPPDLMVAIGAIIEGETEHYRVLADTVIRAIEEIALEEGIPTGLGVITLRTMEQGLERSGGRLGNRGTEAALAALELALWKRRQ